MVMTGIQNLHLLEMSAAEEMVQKMGVLATLPEDQCWLPSTNMVVHNM